MGNFFAELRRRHIYRVGAGYVVVAWALAQVVGVAAQIYAPPAWIPQTIVAVLAIGFPAALIAAWMIEGKAHEAVAAAVRSKNSTVDWILAGGLALVLGGFAYQQLTPTKNAGVQLAGVDAARSISLNPGSGISLAVLPFTNLSSDPEQEFFSDGMTEEITAALAKVPDLRVVGRTSAFQFKGQNRDLRSIGQALAATHLIEGSVRKAGDRVRITAQLIRTNDGTHLWSENYDRQLTDIFVIQEDIARTITASLNMSLGLKPGEQLVANRTIGVEDYQEFLRAKAMLLQGRGAYAEQVAMLEPLVVRNPRYAPAWVAMAQAYNYATQFYSIRASQSAAPTELLRIRDGYLQKTQAAVDRAVELDPESPEGLVGQAVLQLYARKWAMAEEFYLKALAIDPNNPLALSSYANSVLVGLGRIKDAVRVYQRIHDLEPFVPLFAGNFAEALWLDGQTDAAIAIDKDYVGRIGSGSALDLARMYAAIGRYAEAADVLSRYPQRAANPDTVVAAAALLRTAPAKAPAPQSLPRLGNMGFIYLHVGAPERALEYYEEDIRAGLDIGVMWHPSYAVVRKTERFRKIVRAAGYVDYWRAKGWPELCRPTTGDDFECR